MTGWECVKDFYKQHFGIEEWVVELYANLDILQLCASGASSSSIAKFCDLDLEDVVEVLMNTFQFPGWQDDLPMNPYKLFLECEEVNTLNPHEMFKFFLGARLLHSYGIQIDAEKVLAICKTMKDIEERIEDEWV